MSEPAPTAPVSDPLSMRAVTWAVALSLPLAGFWLLIAASDLDVRWEDHRAHFWLVLVTAAINAGLALATGAAARRRNDARLLLVSLAFLASAGFLGLHALATPGVVLDTRNAGFVIATPVGLVVASVFAAASSLDLDAARSAAIVRHARLLQGALLAVMVVWGVASLAAVPPLDDPTPAETASGPLVALSAAGVVLYAVAVVRYARLFLRTRAPMLAFIVSAFVLLAEATMAIAFGRNWQASWWEWHLLMLAAFGLVAYSARSQWHEERFSDLYLSETAARTQDVSIVFADLAGFTAFSQGRDPREVSEMLNAYFEVAIPPVVRESGGEVDKLIGDALMATFNTRGDQPDHPLRAARAALAIQDRTTVIAARHPGWPRFRVGVNSGEAMVGVLGAEGARAYTVIGDTVNIAERIQAGAPIGRVAVAAATLGRLPRALTEPLGGLEVKGRSAPVEAFVLAGLEDEA